MRFLVQIFHVPSSPLARPDLFHGIFCQGLEFVSMHAQFVLGAEISQNNFAYFELFWTQTLVIEVKMTLSTISNKLKAVLATKI